MKKIKRLSQLKAQQRLLGNKQKDLEKQLIRDWTSIRYTLKPGSLAKETFLTAVGKVGEHVFSHLINHSSKS